MIKAIVLNSIELLALLSNNIQLKQKILNDNLTENKKSIKSNNK